MMPLATHWGDGDGAWHEGARRVQSNELWGTSPMERRRCLEQLGFDDPVRMLRFDSDEVWSVAEGWAGAPCAKTPADASQSQHHISAVIVSLQELERCVRALRDQMHPVGCLRFSWDRSPVPDGVNEDWQDLGDGWWRRVR